MVVYDGGQRRAFEQTKAKELYTLSGRLVTLETLVGQLRDDLRELRDEVTAGRSPLGRPTLFTRLPSASKWRMSRSPLGFRDRLRGLFTGHRCCPPATTKPNFS